MARTQVVTEEEIKSMNELYNKGFSLVQLSQMFSYSTPTIFKYINKTREQGRPPILTVPQIQNINRLYDSGSTLEQLAVKVGMNAKSISRYIWHPRPKGRRSS